MGVEINNTGNPYSGKIDQTITQDPQLYRSELNTPVVTDLTLVGANYINNNGKNVTFKSIVLTTVLINVSQAKRIVCTEIDGCDGTVKEYIGMDDYQVSINGILTGPNGSYPMGDVNALHQLAKASVPVQVLSRHLANLDIYSIVIKEFTYDQEAGGYSMQNFSLQCISDAPVMLQMS